MTVQPDESVARGEGTKQDGLPPAPRGGRGGVLIGLAVTALVAYWAFFPALGDTSLLYSQEGRVALIAQHMLQSGDWITPSLLGEDVAAGKPVLYHWLVALLGWMRGFDEVTVRAPSAAAALALAILLYLWARRLTGDHCGLVAALVFVTSVQVMSLAQCAHVDMLLTLWVVLAYYCFFRGYQEEGHRRRWFLLSYVALGLAVMTKGPVGLALVVVGVGSFLLVRRRLGLLREMELLRGTLIFLAVAAPWYVAVGVKTHGQFLVQFFVGQNLARFFSVRSGALHPSKADPWWFYGPKLLLTTLPWTALLLGSLLDRASTLWKRRKVGARNEATALATAWFAAGLLLLSVSKGKRSDYLLPLLPSLALLAGCFWHQGSSRKGKGSARSARVVAVAQAAVLGLAAGLVLCLAVLTPLSPWLRNELTQLLFRDEPAFFSSLVESLRRFLPLGVGATGALILAGWLWLRAALRPRPLARPVRRHLGGTAFAFTVALVLACQWFYQRAALPVLEEWCGLRTVASEVDHFLPPGQSVTVFGDSPHSLLFYLKQPVQLLRARETEVLARAVGEPEPFYCVLPLQIYLTLPLALRAELQPLYEAPPNVRQRFILAANGPARSHGELTIPADAATAPGTRKPQ